MLPRRRLLWVGALIGLMVLVTAGGLPWGAGNAAPVHPRGELRAYTLVAEPVRWEIQPGLVVDGWGYNGSTPGPTIHVTEGDTVQVHLINHLPVPTTIHWHGIDVPPGMDGVPGLSQEPVEPGEDFQYEFVATNPGTRWYHSHVDSNTQIQMGLFGAFIIDPREPEPVHYDRDVVYLLSEKALDFTPAVALGQADITNRDAGNGRGGALFYDLFLMNGKSGTAIPPLTIAEGERIRVRLINAGNLVHAIHVHGHTFKVIATDGNPVPPVAQWSKDVITLGSAERYDIEITGTNPGVWMFHCHVNNHSANGMVTELRYDGAQPVVREDHSAGHGPVAPVASPAAVQPTPTLPAPTTPPTPTAGPPTTPTGGVTPAATSPGESVAITMVDDRYVPSRLTIKVGQRVTWTNNGINLHTTTSQDGLWDSGTLAKGASFTFTFDKPGTYRVFCRQHLLQGMRATIEVELPTDRSP